MGNRLYLVRPDQNVQEMNEGYFELEAKLQEIVEKNPDVLSREWDEKPRKLFLIKREQAVKSDEDGGNSFSLDHLLVDSEGVPVLVEVKRSTDTRTRREVVAQMLDYACRASSWNIDTLKESFIENNTERPDAKDLINKQEFWKRISANLGAEHFRLVFVADRIPETLRLMIEFMDRTMSNIEVYGVELKPYRAADGTMLLSSSVIGNSLDARQKPTYPSRKIDWTRDTFCERVREKMDDEAAQAAEDLIEMGDRLGLSENFGKGVALANYIPQKDRMTVFQVGQLNNDQFVISLYYGDLLRLPRCKDKSKEVLKTEILSIFPEGSKTNDMVKGESIGIPIKEFCDQALLGAFENILKSFL